MGRKLDIDLLVGTEEIAKRLALSTAQRVHDFRSRYDDFPAPVLKLKQSIWYWPDIERWARSRGRLPTRESRIPGRQPKTSSKKPHHPEP